MISTCYTLTWDIKMDWGLLDKNAGENRFLREETVYRYKVCELCVVLIGAELCCAVLYCVVLCCVVPCCAVLYCAVLCCTVLCCAVLCCKLFCCAVLCCAVLCCVVLYCVVLCCTLLQIVLLCCAVLCCALLFALKCSCPRHSPSRRFHSLLARHKKRLNLSTRSSAFNGTFATNLRRDQLGRFGSVHLSQRNLCCA